jgi:hypothetical protein
MTQFEQTLSYKKMQLDPTGTITVAYYKKNGTVITENNIQNLVEEKMEEYLIKKEIMIKGIPNYPFKEDTWMKNYYYESLKCRLGKENVTTEFIQVTVPNVDLELVKAIEESDYFDCWLL